MGRVGAQGRGRAGGKVGPGKERRNGGTGGEGRRKSDRGLVTPVAPVPVGQLGRVHFVGIGGAGMSGIARILLARGVAVSGSDRAASAQLDELAARGALIHVGHSAANLGQADTVVTTLTAIGPRNPALVEARPRAVRMLPRAAPLAWIMIAN